MTEKLINNHLYQHSKRDRHTLLLFDKDEPFHISANFNFFHLAQYDFVPLRIQHDSGNLQNAPATFSGFFSNLEMLCLRDNLDDKADCGCLHFTYRLVSG